METKKIKMESKSELKFKVSAPGKVILLGEHSVVYGKTALAASLGHRTSLLFTSTNNNVIRLLLPMIGVDEEIPIEYIHKLLALPLPVSAEMYEHYNWKRPDLIQVDLMTSQLREFLKDLKGYPFNHSQECALIAFLFLYRGIFADVRVKICSFSMEITSELTLGAGTGSSASYGVCLAAALYHFLRCQEENGKCVSTETFKHSELVAPDLTTFNEDDVKVILSWALVSDCIMHGNPSGIDATVITHGKMITFRRSEGGSTITQVPKMNILLVNSGVTRDTKRMVSGVAERRGRFPKIIDLVLEAMDQVALTARDVFAGSQTAKTSEVSRPDVIATLGELMTINQSLLCSLGVSHPSLDEICCIAKRHGLAAKLTGAGGGGNAIILLPASTNIQALISELEAAGYTAVVALMGGEGVRLHT